MSFATQRARKLQYIDSEATPLKAAPSHSIRHLFTKRTCFFLFPLPFQHFPFDCCHCGRSRTSRLHVARAHTATNYSPAEPNEEKIGCAEPAAACLPTFPAAVHTRKSQRARLRSALEGCTETAGAPSGNRNTQASGPILASDIDMAAAVESHWPLLCVHVH
jgi:hypothetical protein